jgi:hypothetical protein
MNHPRCQTTAHQAIRWAAGILLAGALAGSARAEMPPAAVPERVPQIRQIEAGRDVPALRRIEALREKLPEKYRHRNNFAWAVAKIEGLDKTEYFAHSGIQSLAKLSTAAAEGIDDISLRRRKGRFEVLCVNHADEVEGDDCWPRNVDTEYKILEDLAAHLPDPAAAGRVRLYTDLYPCASCRHVMAQFLAIYTNVQMQVLFRER